MPVSIILPFSKESIQYIKDNGKTKFVVFPIDKFQALLALVEDLQDHRLIEDAKKEGLNPIPIREILDEI